MPLFRPTLLLALLTSPVLAQDDRVLSAAQMTEGLAACLTSKADPAALTDTLGKTGWTNAPDANGTLIFTPPDGDNTLVMRPTDAAQCRVESMDLSTDAASVLLAQSLPTPIPPDTDANGCTRFQLADGASATLISGDDDTACTSEDTSAVLFDFAAP